MAPIRRAPRGGGPRDRASFQRSCNFDANQSLNERAIPAGKLTAVRRDIGQYCTCALRRIEASVPAARFARDQLAVLNGKAALPAYEVNAEHVCLATLKTQLQQSLKG